jgi:hypothetical protein
MLTVNILYHNAETFQAFGGQCVFFTSNIHRFDGNVGLCQSAGAGNEPCVLVSDGFMGIGKIIRPIHKKYLIKEYGLINIPYSLYID